MQRKPVLVQGINTWVPTPGRGWVWKKPRRARIVTITPRNGDRKTILVGKNKPGYTPEILSNPCEYCGGIAETLDHVVPRSKGGGNGRSNYAPAGCGGD